MAYATTFTGTPGTWLEAFDGWRILYADAGVSQVARIAADGSGVDVLPPGGLNTWAIYSPSAGNSPASGNHYVEISDINASPGPMHVILRAAAGSKSGFVLRFASSSFGVWRSDAGALASLGSISLSPGLSRADVFRFSVDGTTLSLLRNGSEIWTYASASQYQSNTEVGIPNRGTSNIAEFIGAWESGDLGSAQPGDASAPLPTVTSSAPAAAASGGAGATAALPVVSLAGPAVAASGGAAAAASLSGISVAAPQAQASAGTAGVATAELQTVAVGPPDASVSGAALAVAALPTITMGAPQAQASAATGAVAWAALPQITISPTAVSAMGAAEAVAALPVVATLSPQIAFGRPYVPGADRMTMAAGGRGASAYADRAGRAVRV